MYVIGFYRSERHTRLSGASARRNLDRRSAGQIVAFLSQTPAASFIGGSFTLQNQVGSRFDPELV